MLKIRGSFEPKLFSFDKILNCIKWNVNLVFLTVPRSVMTLKFRVGKSVFDVFQEPVSTEEQMAKTWNERDWGGLNWTKRKGTKKGNEIY